MSVTRVLCVSALILCYHSVSTTGIGSSCTDNSECMAVANAICGNEICICPDNFVPSASNNKCIRLLKHYDDCKESVECSHSNEMECRDNKCQCKTNFQYDGAQCLGSLGLGQVCERDSECLDLSDPKQGTVWCYGKQCACRNGFKREGTRCVVGGDCTQNSDCDQLENSFCKKLMRDRYQCTCQENYVVAANNTKCLPIARHYEMCEESHQCTYSTETECQDSKCQCSTDTEYKEGHCVLRQLVIGDPCNITDDCRELNNATCLNRVCTCITSFVPAPDNTQCLHKVDHGQPCSESIQCEDLVEAACIDNTCQCISDFNFNGQRCVGNRGLGEQCTRDVECSVPLDLQQETVWCFNRQCSCRNGFQRDNDRCVIGGDCTTDNDCRDLINSGCDTRTRDRFQCACSPNFVAVGNNTKCLPIVNIIGSGCEYDEQCSPNLGNVVCGANNQCGCAEGTSLQNDNTCGAADRILLSLSCFVLVWMVKLL